MEYRDQLKYIKSHQYEERGPERGRRKKRKKKQKLNRGKPGVLDRLLWFVQAVTTLFFLASMAVLGILPRAYMIGACILLIFLLLFVKRLQMRAEKSIKRLRCG